MLEVQSLQVNAAVEASFLASVSHPTRASLVERARVIDVPRGRVLVDGYRDFGGIVVSGLLRVFASEDASGPSITYRNVGPGDAVGLGALLGTKDEIWVQTLTASTVLSLDLDLVADLRATDPSVALALARETMRRLQDTSRELRIWVRGSVRQRTVRRLLDLAADGAGDGPSIAVSHEWLAESIGSRREVVTRALGHLEERGLIRLGRGRVAILDPVGLQSEIAERPKEPSR